MFRTRTRACELGICKAPPAFWPHRTCLRNCSPLAARVVATTLPGLTVVLTFLLRGWISDARPKKGSEASVKRMTGWVFGDGKPDGEWRHMWIDGCAGTSWPSFAEKCVAGRDRHGGGTPLATNDLCMYEHTDGSALSGSPPLPCGRALTATSVVGIRLLIFAPAGAPETWLTLCLHHHLADSGWHGRRRSDVGYLSRSRRPLGL